MTIPGGPRLPAAWLPTVALALPSPAAAAEDDPRPGTLAAAVEQPTGTAEFGFGWLTLPGAEVCVERDEAGCRRGDSSLALEARQVFRPSSGFAAGAGLMLGLTPTTDAPRRDPEGIERDHTRRYFSAEVMARYYPYVGDTVEAWVGVTAGLAVVSDTFATRLEHPNDNAVVGPRGVTIRSEGLALGSGVGIAYEFAPSWLWGGNLRYGSCFCRESRRPLRSATRPHWSVPPT